MPLKAPTKERQRIVTVVYDPQKLEENNIPLAPLRKKRVAAYARVSTELDEQQNSYEAQIEYYKGYIQSKPEWEFIGIYADEGISGTSFKKRDGFNRMIDDAMNGKIDLILTKSISRFSRNTVDSLSITRQLKAKGVEVYFEKENISSMDAQAELLFTIMSSIAQEESRSISENVRWGKQRSMEAGKVSLAWKHFLGYTKGADGLPVIVEEEAKIVRQIYSMYLAGKSFKGIAENLMVMGIKAPKGGQIWSAETVRSILSNEKYKGDARLQKTYTVDFLSKEVRVNHGERKQWYIHDSHDAIIDPGTFELVQREMTRRCARKGKFYDSPFTNKIVCGDCGAYYGHRVWHSNSQYRKNIWLCNDKYEHGKTCTTPKIEDDEIEAAFIIATNRLLKEKDNYRDDYEREMLPMIANTDGLKEQLKVLHAQLTELITQIESLVQENAKVAQSQEEYAERFARLSSLIQHKKGEIERVEQEISNARIRKENVRIYLDALQSMDSVLEKFDIEAWHRLVDYATIMPNNTIVFHMRNGQEETVSLEEVH